MKVHYYSKDFLKCNPKYLYDSSRIFSQTCCGLPIQYGRYTCTSDPSKVTCGHCIKTLKIHGRIEKSEIEKYFELPKTKGLKSVELTLLMGDLNSMIFRFTRKHELDDIEKEILKKLQNTRKFVKAAYDRG